MSVASVTLRGRIAAERAMLDTATVQTITGSTVNATTGVETPTYTLVHTGKCKFQTSEIQESSAEAGGATFTVLRSRVDFPVGAFVAHEGQVITCVTSALDPNMPGRVFRVRAPSQAKSAATAYRLGVEEVL